MPVRVCEGDVVGRIGERRWGAWSSPHIHSDLVRQVLPVLRGREREGLALVPGGLPALQADTPSPSRRRLLGGAQGILRASRCCVLHIGEGHTDLV